MKHKPTYAVFSVALALLLAGLACSTGSTAPTATPTSALPTQAATQSPATAAATAPKATTAPSEAPKATTAPTEAATSAATLAATATSAPLSGNLDVHAVSGYLDSSSFFHVVGLVTNGTDKSVNNIQVVIKLSDSQGKSVLLDDSGNPTSTVTINTILYTLASGESTPFDHNLNTGGADTSGWISKVQVASSATPSDFIRAQVEVRNDQVSVAADGRVYLTGELVNKSDKPAQINDFAGAMLVGPDKVAAAASFDSITRLLSAAGDPAGTDSTPFVIGIDGPVPQGATPAYYIDAVEGNAPDVQAVADVHLKLVASFIDAENGAHVVANITNSGTTTVTVRVVAGLYQQDGKVLDASELDTPIDLLPGQSVPVPLSFFANVNGKSALVAKVVSDTAQIDPFWTFATTSPVVSLKVTNVTTATNSSGVVVKGDLVNTTTQNLTNATIVVIAHDASGKLVASDYTFVSPDSGPFAPKAKLTWTVTINLPASVAPSTLTFDTIVQGRVKQ